MLSAIIAVAVIGADQQAEPLFPRLFPRPTGNNALEYYVRAADYAKVNGLDQWIPTSNGDDMYDGRLEHEERVAEGTKTVLDLIRLGNQRPLSLPDTELMMSAFQDIKHISKLAMFYSRVQFARGNPDEATDALLALFGITDNLRGSGGTDLYLIAIAVDSIACAGFHLAYTSISLNGAEQILEELELYDPSIGAGHWSREIALIDRGFGSSVYDYDAEEWAKIRPTAQLLAGTVADIFATDEKYWMGMSTEITKHLPKKIESSGLPDEYAAQRFIRSTVANRTLRRLVRLHAHIAKFRWEHGFLPRSLDDLPEDARFDPAANQPFVYQLFSEAAYDLYSPGNAYHGKIQLKNFGSDRLFGDPGPP